MNQSISFQIQSKSVITTNHFLYNFFVGNIGYKDVALLNISFNDAFFGGIPKRSHMMAYDLCKQTLVAIHLFGNNFYHLEDKRKYKERTR